MMSIIIMDVWKNTGFFMIIFIAALQGVPKTIMDAAIMDGASYWRRFFRIILPWISPVVFFAIVYASIGALQVYESIVILTQGGPGDATRSMSIYIVEEAFGSFEIGYAASVSVVMTLVILVITVAAARRLAALGAATEAMQTKAAHSDGSTGRSSPSWRCSASSCCCRSPGCSACRSARRRTPTRCRRASCRPVSTSTTTAPSSIRACRSCRSTGTACEIAVIVTVGQLVTCTLAAFAFARLTFPGRDSLFFIMLVGLMFPAQVTIIPIYLGFAQVGLLNQPIGLALMYLTSSFGVFLVRQFMRSQPKALEEAALMDGAGYFKIFYAHLAAPAQAGAVGPRHHHLHPDLELLLPGAGAARAAGVDDAAGRHGSPPRLPGVPATSRWSWRR